MSGHIEASANSVDTDIEGATPLLSFDEAFSLHYRSVYRTARAILNDSFLAEDVVQEVFLRLYHNFHRAPKDELLRVWLLRVTSNVARNMLRTQTRTATRDDKFAKENHPDGIASPALEDAYEHQVELERALRGLNSLREPMRSCLLLKQQGLSYREIATALSLNEKSIGSIIARAQKEFISLYGKSGGEG